jgi:LmbE family N-acetylglucosaminyl deacetylase
MKILCVHAHYDDFEFVAAGSFELWKRKLGRSLASRLTVCTDGKAGHHSRSREETGRIRLEEQAESARLGGYEFELLRLPDGQPPRETMLQWTPAFPPALWKSIRDFEPDYLFCPPLPLDPLAGVHLDHLAVAETVRNVAYLINVPHAYAPEYPPEDLSPAPLKTPVILNVFDGYNNGADNYDLAIDIEGVFDHVAAMAFCHQSQIMEWLPWVGRHSMQPPQSMAEWKAMLRKRCQTQNRQCGIHSDHVYEVFTVTAWGTVPDASQLLNDFPEIDPKHSHIERLKQRLSRWQSLG